MVSEFIANGLGDCQRLSVLLAQLQRDIRKEEPAHRFENSERSFQIQHEF